ncbi:hypothetical protein ILUMI_06123, partial [Ignelater luminosus]
SGLLLQKVDDEEDKRVHQPPGIKLSSETMQFAEEHINSFLGVPAHRRQFVQKKCLQHNTKAISETPYGETLFKKKNVGFHVPRKDQCWCHNFKQLSKAKKLGGLETHNLQLKRKDSANKEKKDDAQKATKKRPDRHITLIYLNDFYDYKSLKVDVVVNTNKAESGDVLNWKEVKWLRFKKATPNLMLYKTDFWDTDFQIIRTTERRGRIEVAVDKGTCPKAYHGFIPLDKNKYDDIMSMCDSKPSLIESTYHDFYKSLPHKGEQDDDSDDQTLAAVRASLLKRKRKKNN